MVNHTAQAPNTLFLRSSMVLFVFRIILIVFLFNIITMSIRVPVTILEFDRDFLIQLYNLNTALIIILMFTQIFLIVLTCLNWANEYYEIKPGRIRHKFGFFFRKEEVFECTHVQEIELEQTFWGRLFNFGSIHIYSPALDRKILLVNIDEPEKNMELIEEIINQEPQPPKNNKNRTIFFQQS